jgi:hypothetical protein
MRSHAQVPGDTAFGKVTIPLSSMDLDHIPIWRPGPMEWVTQLVQDDLISRSQFHLQRPYFQMRSHSQIPPLPPFQLLWIQVCLSFCHLSISTLWSPQRCTFVSVPVSMVTTLSEMELHLADIAGTPAQRSLSTVEWQSKIRVPRHLAQGWHRRPDESKDGENLRYQEEDVHSGDRGQMLRSQSCSLSPGATDHLL